MKNIPVSVSHMPPTEEMNDLYAQGKLPNGIFPPLSREIRDFLDNQNKENLQAKKEWLLSMGYIHE